MVLRNSGEKKLNEKRYKLVPKCLFLVLAQNQLILVSIFGILSSGRKNVVLNGECVVWQKLVFQIWLRSGVNWIKINHNISCYVGRREEDNCRVWPARTFVLKGFLENCLDVVTQRCNTCHFVRVLYRWCLWEY